MNFHDQPGQTWCTSVAHSDIYLVEVWFFGDFRCGTLLFMVIHVIYKYKNR